MKRFSIVLQLIIVVAGLGFASYSFANTPPVGAINDPLYAKGYLNAFYYFSGATDVEANAGATTQALQQAIYDARDNMKVLYLPAGTYIVNDTLRAYTDTENNPADPNNLYKPIAIVGDTRSTRPLIKLAQTAPLFDTTTRKVLLNFRNCDDGVKNTSHPCTDATLADEKPSSGFYQMLRGVDLDTSGHSGAVGLYFNQAQDSSIENVTVTATNSEAGIWGIPSRASGAVNIVVVGGKYGIDTTPDVNNSNGGNVGSVIAGLKLTGQTVSAIRHPGFVLTVVGFEIVAGANVSAITTGKLPINTGSPDQPSHTGALNLIDGTITMSNATEVAIDNFNERNIYLRNVYVYGSNNLVKSGGNAIITGSAAAGEWNQIDEYSYANTSGPVSPPDLNNRKTWNIVDGAAPDQLERMTKSIGSPPANIVQRHVWESIPAVDDADIDNATVLPGNIVASTFQGIIDSNRKIFLRPGVYRLDGPVTLRPNTVLFGAARHLTRIEVNTGSFPIQTCQGVKCDTPIITTDDDAAASTYIGDLSIGVPSSDLTKDYFTAIDWRAGRNSMVHIARPYHNPQSSSEQTNAHNLLKIDGNGGGRWYFLGRGQSRAMLNPDYRILKVAGTSEPLWIYGLDMEHASSDDFAEFDNAENVRIYTVKTEYQGEASGTDFYTTNFLSFHDVTNVALFGHAAIRYAPDSTYSNVKFFGASDGILATLVLPQQNNHLDNTEKTIAYTSATQNLLSSNGGNLQYPLQDPNDPVQVPNGGVSLFKQETSTTVDDTVMTHDDIGYGKSYLLTVSKQGTGSGTVTSSLAGINCGADCSEVYNANTSVTLTGVADATSLPVAWTGCTTVNGDGTCTVSMAAAKTVTATFTLQTYLLTVSKQGTGSGTVTSSPAGVNCGADCSEVYNVNTSVTLTGSADATSLPVTWTGCTTVNGDGSCTVVMAAAKTVTATFTLRTYLLTVSKQGSGSGTVTSSPAGINCGADCSEVYNVNTNVTLTAVADAGSSSASWTGCTTVNGDGTCTVSMAAAKTVTATFTLQTYLLTVSKQGSGSGTVTSSPAGVNCGADCSEVYSVNTSVTLTAVADAGSSSASWTGCTTVNGDGTCTVSMAAAKTVTATFTLLAFISPSAQAALPGGDNDGYQSNPANVFIPADNLTAVDGNSGTNTSTSCTNSGKDKHVFYNYGLTIPAGSAIKGIEVKVRSKADSVTGSPKVCVLLSWDGGTSWSGIKSTPTLGTTLANYTLGSATDLWGRASWNANDFGNANLRVQVVDVASNTARDFVLDGLEVKVTY